MVRNLLGLIVGVTLFMASGPLAAEGPDPVHVAGVIDHIDHDSRMLVVGGVTVVVPDGIPVFDSLRSGWQVVVSLEGEGTEKVATKIQILPN